jgi:demethylmenaquinone methyltransferase/2-methoxy-6-polyprenyl-1,4-benzoquinol methylase
MESERSASEAAHATAVREMFSGIASRYDFLNHFLSLNIDKRWRRVVAGKLSDVLSRKDAAILDIACGTGDLSLELYRNARGTIVGTDFCHPMLVRAVVKARGAGAAISFVESDALDLAFPDGHFDALTIAFGLRNLANFEEGLIEMRRVLKPGGKLVILEFSSPVVPGFRQLFNFYFSSVLPRIGGAVSGSRQAYEYLPNSVRKFPDQKALLQMLREVGFENADYQNLTGGIAAVHSGIRSS